MNARATREQVPQIVRSAMAPRPRAPIAGPAPGGGVSGREILRILRRRKWLILLSVGICSVLAGGATLLWLRFAPFYTASAYIKIEAPKGTALRGVALLPPTEIMDRLLATQAQLVYSETVLRMAAEHEDVRRTSWYRRHSQNVVEELEDEITVAPVPRTEFISVRMTSLRRREIPIIVNAVAEAGVQTIRDIASKAYKNERERLDDTYNRLRDNLGGIQQEIKRLTAEMVESYTALQDNYRILLQELNRSELEMVQTRQMKEYVESQPEDVVAQLDPVRGMLEGNRELVLLRDQETQLRIRLDTLSERFGEGHLTVKGAQTRLKNVQREILQKQGLLAGQYITAYKQSLKIGFDDGMARLLELRERVDEAKTRLKDAEKKIEQRDEKITEGEVIKDRMDRLQDRQMDVNLLEREHRVSLAKPAEEPREPSSPRWEVMMPLGVFIGLVIGLGFTFVLEFIDTSIKSPSDVARRVDLPLLGMIPHTDDLEEEITDLRLAFMTNPNSLVCEAFRQVRTCLLFSGPAGSLRSLLITSPLPADGRGTVAMNLAASVAHGGRKALVVDANFRQPMIQTLFTDCPADGLSSALVGRANWRDLLHEVEPNLYVMSAGPMPPNPAELLGSEPMRQLVAEMSEEFDQILFDGAPCLVVTDSAILSTLVDGVVLVVRAGANTFGIVQRSRDILARVGAHIIGIVLNGVRTTAGGYLRKNYETFYAYHEQPRLEAKVPIP